MQYVLTCKADICSWFFICECRLTHEIRKNVSTENISMYTVHEVHMFLHVSCMIRVRHQTCIKHAWYETCAVWNMHDKCMAWSTHDSVSCMIHAFEELLPTGDVVR